MQFKCLLQFYLLWLHMEKRVCENWKKALRIYNFHVQKPLASLLAFNIFSFLKERSYSPHGNIKLFTKFLRNPGVDLRRGSADLCKGILWLLENSSLSFQAGVVGKKLLQTN